MTVDPRHEEYNDNSSFRAPLLLHSLSALREVVFPCLDKSGARIVVEIGGEDGAFTQELVAWAERVGGEVYCVEPHPSERLVELCDASSAAELVRDRSPGALENLEKADAYVLDGDHNYYTVKNELETIERKSGDGDAMPLVFLHDVGWPCGRRDQYYSPESLPAEAVHPHTYDRGVTPQSSGVVKGGFRGAGEFAVALQEGGEANGVLTAVDDFLRGHPDLALSTVPSVFGLGIIHPTSSSAGQSVGDFLRFYDSHPVLERLEQNRLTLYLRVLELQDDVATLSAQLETSLLRHRDVAIENRALWARSAELEDRVRLLEGELQILLHSRAFSVAERLSNVRQPSAGKPGISRGRLIATLRPEKPQS